MWAHRCLKWRVLGLCPSDRDETQNKPSTGIKESCPRSPRQLTTRIRRSPPGRWASGPWRGPLGSFTRESNRLICGGTQFGLTRVSMVMFGKLNWVLMASGSVGLDCQCASICFVLFCLLWLVVPVCAKYTVDY